MSNASISTQRRALCITGVEIKNLGRKTVLGVGFEVKKKTKASKVIPMYDHYGSGFSNCDKFNKCIHKKYGPSSSRETRG